MPAKMAEQLDSPWTLWAEDLAEVLGVAIDDGLSDDEADARRSRFGPNQLRQVPSAAWWALLVRQFKSLVVVLLGAAAILAMVFGEIVEALAIFAVLAINAGLGFVAEHRAVRSMEALRRLGSVKSRVRRGGRELRVDAELVVPGDLLLLEPGDRVVADVRVIEASKLEADESVLTGESVPVSKSVGPLAAEVDLADRTNMLFKGTTVTRGTATCVVVATGMQTELGHIATLVEEADEETTPLERRLAELGRWLIFATLAAAAAVSVFGILSGRDALMMVETGIALAVAAIPEGLPIVATIALARGMWRMARRNALINRLSAVETLGATTLILTDKTGTLTENRMTVGEIVSAAGAIEIFGRSDAARGEFRLDGRVVSPSEEPTIAAALRVAALCNGAAVHEQDGKLVGVGDPLEIALLVAAAKGGLDRRALIASHPEVVEEAFDPARKMMATVHDVADGYEVAVKGAAESVLRHCSAVLGDDGEVPLDDTGRRRWQETNVELATRGYRVLAAAAKRVPNESEEPYRDLTFIGLFGLLDPAREGAREAIEACRNAGIRVVMVTGDQAATARFIAEKVGLLKGREARVVVGHELPDMESLSEEQRRRLLAVDIYARVDPEQKLQLIALHRHAGEVVAMTGDGVNDAPALKKADIGIAMGRRGTQVAQEASDMVLTDDSFASIVAAVHQGRVIFGNIRKFVLYLMSCNVSEVLVVSAASAFALPLPLLPLQILFLNLVTDVFPALALALGEGGDHLMHARPRDPRERILERRHWAAIGVYGVVITVAVLGSLRMATAWLGHPEQTAVTISFATLALAQLWHVFNMRTRGTSLFGNDVVRNPWVWQALALCVALIAAAIYLPGLSALLRTTRLGVTDWAIVLPMSFIPWGLGQAWASAAPGPPAGPTGGEEP